MGNITLCNTVHPSTIKQDIPLTEKRSYFGSNALKGIRSRRRVSKCNISDSSFDIHGNDIPLTGKRSYFGSNALKGIRSRSNVSKCNISDSSFDTYGNVSVELGSNYEGITDTKEDSRTQRNRAIERDIELSSSVSSYLEVSSASEICGSIDHTKLVSPPPSYESSLSHRRLFEEDDQSSCKNFETWRPSEKRDINVMEDKNDQLCGKCKEALPGAVEISKKHTNVRRCRKKRVDKRMRKKKSKRSLHSRSRNKTMERDQGGDVRKPRNVKCINLKSVCNQLAEFSKTIVLVYAATEHGVDTPKIHLLCLTIEECPDLPGTFDWLQVLQKPFYPSTKESLEAENAAISLRKTKKLLEQIKRIKETIAFHAEDLMKKHSNLEAIKMSLVCSSKDGIKQKPCIVLFCRCKSYIPFQESNFPTKLRHPRQNTSFETDVREGFFTLCANGHTITRLANEWNGELAMGCSIGPENDIYSASIGPFVNIRETNETCFLTVRHLFQPLDKPSDQVIGTQIVQPADGDMVVSFNQAQSSVPNRRCGNAIVAEINGRIDATLIKICDERIPTRGNFVGVRGHDLHFAGFTEQQYPTYDDGSMKDATKFTTRDFACDRVIKFGKETGLRKGSLRIANMAVRVVTETGTIQHGGRVQRRTMIGQLQVDSYARKTFFQEGDSGSAVFLVDRNNKLHCIGMAIGVMSDLTCVVTPIQVILQELGAKLNQTLELKCFNHEDMDETN